MYSHTITILSFLARCYVVAKVYKVLRAHVHMFTIIQFLRVRASTHTVLEAENMFIVSNGLENSYQPIPRFVCNMEALNNYYI